MDEKQKKLDRLLSLLDPDNALSKKDFVDSFQKVVDIVQTILQKHEQGIQELQKMHNELVRAIRQETDINLKDIKGKVNDIFVGERISEMEKKSETNHAEMKKMMSGMIKNKMDEMDMETKYMKDLLSDETKKKKDEMDLHMKTYTLNGKIDIDSKLIAFRKEFKQDFQDLRTILQNIPRGKSMGRAKVPIIRAVDLTNSVDGSATTFTLPPDTVQVLGVWSSQFPITFRANTDWTVSGNTLTIVTGQLGTLQSGQTLWALCETLFYP